MLSVEDRKEIEELFGVFIEKLKEKNMLRKTSDSIYTDMSQRLFGYYKYGETDIKMKNILSNFQDDRYFNIIPLFYKNKYTIDNISEMLFCDTSTVVRNKKRLCISIYLMLQQEK